MKRLLLSALLTLLCATPLLANDAPVNELGEKEKAEGWKLLFDGDDASPWWRGYKKDGLPEVWKVENDTLVLKGKGGDIITKEQYESFEFALDWKIAVGGNSGIMFKVKETDGPPWATGPEVQIQDNVKGHDPQKAGWLYQFYAAELDATKPAGEWNHFVLRCQKTATGTYHCTHWMNGVPYVDYEIGSADWNERFAKSKFKDKAGFAKADAGHICLQDHGNEVAFRNIKIRVLPTAE
jgi:opacity protein-like surface antigen